MTTIQNLEHLADAVEALVEDHKARVQRIEGRRQQLALHEAEIARLFAAARATIDGIEAALKEHFLDWEKLEDAELAETNGEPEKPGSSLARFETIMGGKPNGDGRGH